MIAFQENMRLALCGCAIAVAMFSHACVAPARSMGTARSTLQSQVHGTVDKLKEYVKNKLKKLESSQEVAGGMQVVERETGRNNAVMDGLHRQQVELEKTLGSLSGYDDFKEKFDKLRQAIDKGMENVGSNPSRDELEKQAEAEQEDAREKQKEAEDAKKAAEDGEKVKDDGTSETLSEAAQKAVEEERQRRKTEAEEKAKAEGKDPSEATWEDLTEDEIIEIADRADGLEDVSDEDRAEGENLQKTYNQGK